MCTASWSVSESRLTLCFSRDERKTRSEAYLPKVYSEQGIRYIAAIDPDGGGTWAAVNEYGLCVFLLNNYRASLTPIAKPRGLLSRGLLPVRLVGATSRIEAIETFRSYSLEDYNPFILCFADRDGVEGFSWDRINRAPADLSSGMVTTCSFRSEEIESYRKERYAELSVSSAGYTRESQWTFHTELSHEDPAFNALMFREESRTHSIAKVDLELDSIRFGYRQVIGEERELGEEHTVGFAAEGVGDFARSPSG